jgi:hypothetical protein
MFGLCFQRLKFGVKLIDVLISPLCVPKFRSDLLTAVLIVALTVVMTAAVTIGMTTAVSLC